MKKLLTMIVGLMLVADLATGQDFKKFKVGIGVGYGVPSEGQGGVLVYLEPMYRIQDAIAIGLRIESAAFLGKPISGTPYSTSAFGVGSYTLSGQYYFGNGGFRPFVGAGFGMFMIVAATGDINGTSVSIGASSSVIGFYPRVGFDLGHFNVCIDYNLIPSQQTDVVIGGLNIGKQTSDYGYLGVKIGASIGGGKK